MADEGMAGDSTHDPTPLPACNPTPEAPIHLYQRSGVAEEGSSWRGEGAGDIQTGEWGTSLLGWPVSEQSRVSQLVPLALESLGKGRRLVATPSPR